MAEDRDWFMGLALEEAERGKAEGNVPVGSVIVRDGKVVGRGRNRVDSDRDPTCHAEVDALRDACRNLDSRDLSGAACYTTMEPCPMCCWALQEARVARLVLGARHAEMRRTDYGRYSVEALLELTGRSLEIETGVRTAECEAIRRSWTGRVEPEA